MINCTCYPSVGRGSATVDTSVIVQNLTLGIVQCRKLVSLYRSFDARDEHSANKAFLGQAGPERGSLPGIVQRRQ